MIDAGRLNRTLEIWNPTQTQTTSGQIDYEYTKETTVRCSVIEDNASESLIGGKTTIIQKYTMLIRYNVLIHQHSKLVLYRFGSSENVEMDVESIRELDTDVLEVIGVKTN